MVEVNDQGPDPGDRVILERATATGRILITIDTDFGLLVYAGGMAHGGLVRLPDVPAQHRIQIFAQLLQHHEQDLAAGAVITVSGGRIRISRRRPGLYRGPPMSSARRSPTSAYTHRRGPRAHHLQRCKDGTAAVELEPHSLLARLCAAVPPPRLHTVRYGGVHAPAAKLRPLVVPPLPPPTSGAAPGTGVPAAPAAPTATKPPTHRCGYRSYARRLAPCSPASRARNHVPTPGRIPPAPFRSGENGLCFAYGPVRKAMHQTRA